MTRPFILTQVVVFMASALVGCSSDLSSQYPGMVSSALPGATLISQADFNTYLQDGRMAPYKSNSSQGGGSSAGDLASHPASAQEFVGAASLGNDMMLVKEYVAKQPRGGQLQMAYTNPQGISEAIDALGRKKKIQLTNNDYRITSIAHTLRGQGRQKQVARASFPKAQPKSLLAKVILPTPPRRGLASVTEEPLDSPISYLPTPIPSPVSSPTPTPPLSPANTIPTIVCSSSEIGHGLGIDTGSVVANTSVVAPHPVYSDGLISNFDWPLKSVASCIKDQGIRGTCTAFAVVGAMETLIQKNNSLSTNFSEQALFFRGKGFLDQVSPDSDGFAAVYFLEDYEKNPNHLASYETAWDYNISPQRETSSDFKNSCSPLYKEFCSASPEQGRLYCTQPTGGAPIQCGYLNQIVMDTNGANVSSYESFLDTGNIASSLNQAIDYLSQGVPVIVETTLTTVFYSPYHGYVAEPGSSDRTEGGHSTLMVGYVSEADLLNTLPARAVTGNGGYFVIKNSWGPYMGDSGYFYVSFNYFVKYAYSLFAVQSVKYIQ